MSGEELKTLLGKNSSQGKREGGILWFKDDGSSEVMGTFECVVSSLRLGPTDKQAVFKTFSQRSYKTCESRTVVP